MRERVADTDRGRTGTRQSDRERGKEGEPESGRVRVGQSSLLTPEGHRGQSLPESNQKLERIRCCQGIKPLQRTIKYV